jgi:hypothetical protein
MPLPYKGLIDIVNVMINLKTPFILNVTNNISNSIIAVLFLTELFYTFCVASALFRPRSRRSLILRRQVEIDMESRYL